jgi:hypothetical protein
MTIPQGDVERVARELLAEEYGPEQMFVLPGSDDSQRATWLYRRDQAAIRAITRALSMSPLPTGMRESD